MSDERLSAKNRKCRLGHLYGNVKGSSRFDKFMLAVREDYDWPLGYPEHLWVKATPDSTGNRNCLYHFVDRSVRGSFPVTFSTEAYDQYSYESVKESLL